MNPILRYQLLLHLVVLIFGFTGILGELITLPAVLIVVYRMAIAVAVLLVYTLTLKKQFSIPRNQIVPITFTGILIALHWLLFFQSIKVSNVSVTLAVLSSATLFTAILEPLIYKRRIIRYEIFLGLVVVAGLYMIFRFETHYALGIILTLFSALAASLFTVLNGIFARKYEAVHISMLELSGGGAGIALTALFLEGSLLPAYAPPAADWFYLILLGTVCTAFAYVASVHVMKKLTPYSVTMSINMEPVYGILLAFVLLNEDKHLSAGFYAGALVILAAVFTNAWLKHRSQKHINTDEKKDH